MMTTLLLVRHGQTVWHEGPRYAGSSDIELTDLGHAQAQQLAAWAPSANLDAIVSSQLRRAVQTAQPAADACGLTLRTDARLAEVDFGTAEGLTRPQVAETMADALAAHLAAPMDHALPGGERGLEVVARAAAAFRGVCAEFPDGRVLVVGHSMTTRLVLCVLLGIDPSTVRTVMPYLGNGTVTTVDLAGDGSTALRGYNVPIGDLPS
ncbi:histidine phosphatase family protein [Sanguibacter sp. A247]|uniref:histidine phosphatase family protein n=1 Tax=unclassified Sanguibacter TaxID=2645534 RepID=UPI003FD8EFBD